MARPLCCARPMERCYTVRQEDDQGVDAMLFHSPAKTEMIKFWQFLFDNCNEDFTCVLGWITAGLLVFLGIVMGLGAMMTRLNKRQ
jgi:hypothetical protein